MENHQHLPAECEKVHDVIASRSVGNVTAVHVHCVFYLADPRLVVHLKRVDVRCRELRQAIQYRIELCNLIRTVTTFQLLIWQADYLRRL